MTLPSTTDVKNLIGGYNWSAIDGTTTTIVTALITRAASDISAITSTTVGFSGEIAYRASELAVNNVAAGSGPESVANDTLDAKRTYLAEEWKRMLLQRGYSAKGERIYSILSDEA